ncbi:MAG: sialidase family protein [Candidatus Sumerlaeota bacterium]|nr:sialidase family protein [Candidatus Sumerlaeota bacterium]
MHRIVCGTVRTPRHAFGAPAVFLLSSLIILGAADAFAQGSWLKTVPNPSASPGGRFASHAMGLKSGFAAADPVTTSVTPAGIAYFFNEATTTPRLAIAKPSDAGAEPWGGIWSRTGGALAFGCPSGGTGGGCVKTYDTESGALITAIPSPRDAWGAGFGQALADAGTSRVLIGHPGADYGATDSGLAYLYDANGLFIRRFDNPAFAANCRFGQTAAINGSTAIINSPGNTIGSANGSLYFFDVNTGALTGTLNGQTNQTTFTQVSHMLPLSGNRVAVGIPDPLGPTEKLYLIVDITSGTVQTQVRNPNPPPLPNGKLPPDRFGSANAIFNNQWLIGAPDTNTSTGIVYLYDTTSTPVKLLDIANPFPKTGDRFGSSVCFSGPLMFAGADNSQTTGAKGNGTGYLLSGYRDAWDPTDDITSGATKLTTPTLTQQAHGTHVLNNTDVVDWFKADLPCGNVYNFNSIGSSGNLRAELYRDTEQAPAALSTTTMVAGEFSLSYSCSIAAAYYLRVFRGNPATTPEAVYQLNYEIASPLFDPWDPADDVYASATQLANPATTDTSHGPHTLQTCDRADWFKIRLEAGSAYLFSGANTTGSLYAGVLTKPADLSSTIAESLGPELSMTCTPATTADYYILIKPLTSDFGPLEDYILRYTLNYRNMSTSFDAWDPTDNTITSATLLPTPCFDTLKHGPHKLSRYDAADWFKIDLKAYLTYNFNTAGGSGAIIAELYSDLAGVKLVARDGTTSGSAGGGMISITYTPQAAGTYYLKLKPKSTSAPDCAYYLTYSLTSPRTMWSDPAVIANGLPPGSYDNEYPRLAANGRGLWIAVWMSIGEPGSPTGEDWDIFYSRSLDNGVTWSLPSPLNTNAPSDRGNDMVPQIATDEAGNWVVVWTSFDELGLEGDIMCSRSVDEGLTWSDPTPVNNNAPTDLGEDSNPQIATDREGRWIAVWMSFNTPNGEAGTDWDIYCARSTNAGKTWSDPLALNDDATTDISQDWSPQIAADGNSNWVVVWSRWGGITGDDWDIMYTRSTNNGISWTAVAPINPNAAKDAGDDQFPKIVFTGGTNWMAVWQSTNTPSGALSQDHDIFFSRSTNGGAAWTLPAALNSDASVDGRLDWFPALASDSLGKTMALWYGRSDAVEPVTQTDILYAIYDDSKAQWTPTTLTHVSCDPVSTLNYYPTVATDRNGTWLASWSREAPKKSSITPNREIIVTRAATAAVQRGTFDTNNLQPPGSLDGWSIIGYTEDGFTSVTWASGAYRVIIPKDPADARIAGVMANLSEWLPYSVISAGNYVRLKYYIFTTGQENPNDPFQVPNFRVRAQTRFAVASLLEVFHHSNDPSIDTTSTELRPSASSTKPSVYRVDFDPVDVPYLRDNASVEGVQPIFEAYAIYPQDNGVLGFTELDVATYPASALPNSIPPIKIYEPSTTDAGSLKVYNPVSDLQIFNLIPSTNPGKFPVVDTSAPLDQLPTYAEGAFGITMDASNVPANRIGVVNREFFAGEDNAARARVSEGRQYKIRWHVVSTQQSNLQSQLRLRSRAIKFAWSTKMEIGGAWATGAISPISPNNMIAQQALPGIGCQNPDKNGEENGGWYTMLVNTPMSADIRPELPPQFTLSARMPNITALPGPGDPTPSRRDLILGTDLIDTISSGLGRDLERGNFTIDRIEVREYEMVSD